MLSIDLENGLRNIAQTRLAAMGHSVNLQDDTYTALCKYLNAKNRAVPVVEWAVAKSSELASRTLSATIQTGLTDFLDKASRGEDLNPHLSKTMARVDYNDLLFNDWGFYHFHLGLAAPGQAFSSRTGELLFVIARQGCFYCIDVMDHAAFSCVELLKIVHRNWPYLLARFSLNGIIRLETQYTDDELKNLRRAGVQVLIQMDDGTVYGPPGGGLATDGSNIALTLKAMRYMKRVRAAEERLSMMEQRLRAEIAQTGKKLPISLSLRLADIDDSGMQVIEENSGHIFMIRS